MNEWLAPQRRETQDVMRTQRRTIYPCLGESGVAEAFLEKGDLEPGHAQGTGHEKPFSHLLSPGENLICSKPHR